MYFKFHNSYYEGLKYINSHHNKLLFETDSNEISKTVLTFEKHDAAFGTL